jgi:ribosome maturation factor RimP
VSSVSERVHTLIEPILADLGLRLYDLDHAGGVLRVVVERPEGVDLDAIAEATRLISRELDHADPIPGRYQLEVTSPGLERNLRVPRHFQGAVGSQVKVRTHPHVEGERRSEGVLSAADDDGIVILEDGGERRLRYADVERARTVFIWEPAPKPGHGPRRAGKVTTAGNGPQGKAHAS